MILYDAFIAFDRAVAGWFLGERRGRTVSQVAGASVGRALDISARAGTILFHVALVGGLALMVVGGVAWHRRRSWA
ncbi:MAG: hypothetical protein WC654_00050 [Patescibacteria group bacterium]